MVLHHQREADTLPLRIGDSDVENGRINQAVDLVVDGLKERRLGGSRGQRLADDVEDTQLVDAAMERAAGEGQGAQAQRAQYQRQQAQADEHPAALGVEQGHDDGGEGQQDVQDDPGGADGPRRGDKSAILPAQEGQTRDLAAQQQPNPQEDDQAQQVRSPQRDQRLAAANQRIGRDAAQQAGTDGDQIRQDLLPQELADAPGGCVEPPVTQAQVHGRASDQRPDQQQQHGSREVEGQVDRQRRQEQP